MKKKILVFENDDLSQLDLKKNKHLNFFFINPSAYFKNRKYVSNYNYYGLDFNEFVYDNFLLFETYYKKSLENLKTINLDDVVKETISNLIIPIISLYFFSTYKLNNRKFYFIQNNSLIEVNEENFIIYFEKFLLHENQLIFLRNKSQKQFFSKLNAYLNKLILRILKNKSYIHIQDLSYGFKNLVVNDKANLYVSLNYWNKNNFFKSLKSFFEYIFYNKNYINISIPITNKINIEKLEISIFDHINKNLSKITNKTFNFLNQYSQNLKINFDENINNNFNPRFSLFHNLKWIDDLIFSTLTPRVLLASHSSHPLPQNKISTFFLKDLSRGLLNSNFASNILIQSQETLKSFKKFDYNLLETKLVNRFVWGYASSNSKFIKSKNITLIHASTFKVGSFRPYIYESSNLYFKKLKKLCQIIKSIDEYNLILRPCINDDFKLEYYEEMLNDIDSDKISLSYTKAFVDDLAQSDFLISFSSTTIEEALLLNKKILLLTSDNEHKHFDKDAGIDHIDIFNMSSIDFKNTIDKLSNTQLKVNMEKNFRSIKSIINE